MDKRNLRTPSNDADKHGPVPAPPQPESDAEIRAIRAAIAKADERGSIPYDRAQLTASIKAAAGKPQD